MHTADIVRNKNGFEKLIEKPYRDYFYTELNKLIKELQFKVVACVIKKDKHLSRYGLAALDPYFLSLDILVEIFCMEIKNITKSGIIIAERRNPTLDHQLDLAWLNLKIQGTHYIKAKKIENCISSLNLKSKKENIAGLQLADLVVTPIGRYVLGKSVKEDFKIIKSKFRSNKKGEWEGYGLIVLPK